MADLSRLLLEPSYRGSATAVAMLLGVARDARRVPSERIAAVIAVTANEGMRSEVLALARATADPELLAIFERAARDGGVEARRVQELEGRRT